MPDHVLIEEPLQFGEERRLFGILTLPIVPAGSALELPVFVFLSAGLLHRVGPYRLHVRLVRELAQMGFSSLRVDLAGRGDSPPRPGLTNQQSVAADFAEILRVLESRLGRSPLVLAGLCTGADNAIMLARKEPRVVGMVLFDPFCFPDRGFRKRAVIARYGNPARQIAWLKRRFKALTKPPGKEQPDNMSADGLAFRDLPTREQVRAVIESIRGREGRVLSIFTQYARRYYNRTGQMGRALGVNGYQQFCTELFWPQVDHTYSLELHRRRLMEEIKVWAGHYIRSRMSAKDSDARECFPEIIRNKINHSCGYTKLMFHQDMKNRLVYIIRLDDASPTMDHQRWAAVEHVLNKYDIKPVVAVVPNNIDPVLVRSNIDPNFWGRVRSWQSMGWHIAMHGYSHEALTTNKGLVPLNNKSEFAGVSDSEQRRRIRLSMEIFRNNGVEPKIWVAPFHTFDRVTLRALSIETNIRVVSDGVAKWPFSEMGFFWIPQQLWGPEEKASGVWTICLHPNDTPETLLESLEQLILTNKRSFVWSIDELLSSFASRRRSVSDLIQQKKLVCKRNLETKVTYQKIMSVASRCKRLFLTHLGEVRYRVHG